MSELFRDDDAGPTGTGIIGYQGAGKTGGRRVLLAGAPIATVPDGHAAQIATGTLGQRADITGDVNVSNNAWEQHPLFSLLSGDGSFRAFEKMYLRSREVNACLEKQGKLTGKQFPTEGIELDKLMEKKCPEMEYDMPDDYIAINRSFFPQTFGDEMMTQYSVQNMPSNSSPEDIKDMNQLMKEMKEIIGNSANSKIMIHSGTLSSEERVNGKKVSTYQELTQAWKKDPSVDGLAESLYNVMYDTTDNPENFNKLVNTIMLKDLKIWCTVHDGSKDLILTGKQKDKPKVNAAAKLVRNKGRDTCRSKVNSCAHGVKIVVTHKGGRKSRRKKKFIHEENVTGWHGEKHMKWLQQQRKEVTYLLHYHVNNIVSRLMMCVLPLL